MVTERPSLLRLVLLAALTIVVLTATMIPSLGTAVSASPEGAGQVSLEKSDVQGKGYYYLNSRIRCPGKKGAKVWDPNGKGRPSLGPGIYVCKWSSDWDTLMWYKEVHKGSLPCGGRADQREAVWPGVEPKC